MITIKQLNYALAAAKALHFKKAAETCFVSPSTLSTAIAELESELGIRIFERDNKKVLVTPMGEKVLEKAQAIKIQMQDFTALGQSLEDPMANSLSLGIIPTIGPFLIPLVLPALQKKYPKLQLSITENQSNTLIEQLEDGDLEMAILALPFDIKGLTSHKFWEEDFYYVTHKNQISAQTKEVNTKNLNSSRLLLLDDGHCLKEHALKACEIPSGGENLVKVTSLSTLVQLVASDMGSTLVPQMAVESLIDSNALLRRVHLNQKSPHREIALVTRPSYPGSAIIKHLIDTFSEELSKKFNRNLSLIARPDYSHR
jgi:LysR family hydrogen peroxide-inducible transcriptional activator